MKGFFLYPVINMITTILQISTRYFHLFPTELFRTINLISLLFHFTFLSLFIYQFFKTKNERKYYQLLFLFFIILLTIFIIKDIYTHYVISFGIANTGLFVFCILYYNLLLRNTPNLYLFKEPSFWVITGILFGMSTTIPISFMGGYLYHNLPRNIFFSIASILPLGYGIMHVFFIKAILCSVQPQRPSSFS